MKTIESLAAEKYNAQKSLPVHKQIPAENFIDWAQFGAREVQRWFSTKEELPINDKNIYLIGKSDINGVIPCVCMYWNDHFYNPYTEARLSHITSWRPINRL